MQKAQSRLKRPATQEDTVPTAPASSRKRAKQFKTGSSDQLPIVYGQHLPLLILAIVFYGATYFLLTHTYPSQIQHFIIPDSYLPLQLLLFLANFFLISFVFLSSRRGLLLSAYISVMLFFHLQHIIITPAILTITAFPFILIELIVSVLKRHKHLL